MEDELSVEAIATRARALRHGAAMLADAGDRRAELDIVLDDIAMAERWLAAPNAAVRPHILRIASDALRLAEARLRAIDSGPPDHARSSTSRGRVLPLTS